MPPKVSIIMNCLNSSAYLKEALDSIAAQTYSNWEVIFWDNCSTDTSVSIAMEYGEKVKVIRELDTTIPLGDARNYALKHATGEYIAFLDCDDLWEPTHLEIHVTYLEAHHDVGFSYSNFAVFYDSDKPHQIQFKEKQPSGDIFTYSLLHYPIGILTVVFRKTLLDELDHWFDPKLNLVEDYDLFLRMVKVTKAKYHHDVTARYRKHDQNTTRQNIERFPREMLYTLNKFKTTMHLTAKERRILEEERRFQRFRGYYHHYYKEKKPFHFFIAILYNRAFPVGRIIRTLVRRLVK
ncbi:MAG: glycosyltransferase [bacterium]|nr:glycosyltransferase [bacterium]